MVIPQALVPLATPIILNVICAGTEAVTLTASMTPIPTVVVSITEKLESRCWTIMLCVSATPVV